MCAGRIAARAASKLRKDVKNYYNEGVIIFYGKDFKRDVCSKKLCFIRRLVIQKKGLSSNYFKVFLNKYIPKRGVNTMNR
mgnify:CR=1 FL=1